MARAIWSGAVSFGLVNIPVKLYNAVSRKSVSFNQLDARTGARVRQKLVSSSDGEEVTRDNVIKGYSLGADQYVQVGDDELAAIMPTSQRTIELEEFVDLVEIDPVFYDSAYWLVPDKAAVKPYALLSQAMEESQKVGIARFVMRSKQYVSAIRPRDGKLALATMVYADELTSVDDLAEIDAVDKVELNDREVAMAVQLVESLSAEFEPEKYTDTYREQVLELIERKAAGEVLAAPAPAAAEESKVVDLLAALEASVEAAKASRGNHPASRAAAGKVKAKAAATETDEEAAAPARKPQRPQERLTAEPVPASKKVETTIGGQRLVLSNLDKVLYPAAGFTKAEVIDYYVRAAPTMLDHVGDRGVTLRRYPNGVDGTSFFEKRCASHRPDWVPTALGPGDSGGAIGYCLLDSVPALAWAANMAALEVHGPMARAADIETPTMVVFDLDPGEPATIIECCAVGLEIHDVLDALGLQVFPKTSGSKGLQLYLPLNTPGVGHADASAFALAVAQLLERRMKGKVLSTMDKAARTGKVFVDWSQNSRHKTTIAPYSLRARERPTVSTPLDWDEVAAGAEGADLRFEAADVLARLEEHGDLFAPTVTLRQELPHLQGA